MQRPVAQSAAAVQLFSMSTQTWVPAMSVHAYPAGQVAAPLHALVHEPVLPAGPMQSPVLHVAGVVVEHGMPVSSGMHTPAKPQTCSEAQSLSKVQARLHMRVEPLSSTQSVLAQSPPTLHRSRYRPVPGVVPVSIGGVPVSVGGAPVSIGGVPVSIGGVPVSMGGVPVSVGGVPESIGGTPESVGGVPESRVPSGTHSPVGLH